MRKELSYFNIENSFGGNQDWFKDPMMKLGGCAAITACDFSLKMALHDNKTHLYPYDIQKLNKEDYIKFAMKMKPYLRPRLKGVNTLKLFIDGIQEYFNDVDEVDLLMQEFNGDMKEEEAAVQIKTQIDNGIPIPYLLLKHKNHNFKDFAWHWFLVVGYEEFEKDFYIKVATYSNAHWLSLNELWETGYKEKGGMVIMH
ncbi:hypothetical protein [[Clostridium] fimetarium]|uniref:Peptidase C39-like domain-containing protein n=1 Tax=[Clostridium] fimetarium TaxID=99656 RepID=A0A1I0QH13_9FIRM|nr:hypothetical protein [[Clostridium] fimetarium]SEW26354.1 hypothetical protein SAMN05421659_10816 [[Clostridium] fimetarium]